MKFERKLQLLIFSIFFLIPACSNGVTVPKETQVLPTPTTSQSLTVQPTLHEVQEIPAYVMCNCAQKVLETNEVKLHFAWATKEQAQAAETADVADLIITIDGEDMGDTQAYWHDKTKRSSEASRYPYSLGWEYYIKANTLSVGSHKITATLVFNKDHFDGAAQFHAGDTVKGYVDLIVGYDWATNLEAVKANFPSGIPGMDAFLPLSLESTDDWERIGNILQWTQEARMPNGYFVEPLYTPGAPIQTLAIDGEGNIFVSTVGVNAFVGLFDPLTGETKKFVDIPNWGLSVVADSKGVGAWFGLDDGIHFVTPDGDDSIWLPGEVGWFTDVGPDGLIYGIGWDGKLSRWSKQGREVLTDYVIDNRVVAQSYVAVDDQGVIYVSDSSFGGLWRLNNSREREIVLSSGWAPGDPEPLKIAPDGTIYGVGSIKLGQQVFTIDPITGKMTGLEGIGHSLGLHFLPFDIDPRTGALYFAMADQRSITKIDPNKEPPLVPEIILRGGGNTLALEAAPDGNVYFADSTFVPLEPATIFKLQPTGELQSILNLDSDRSVVKGISMGPDSMLYISTFDGNNFISKLIKIDPDSGQSEAIYTWDQPGAKRDSAAMIISLSANPITGDLVVYNSSRNTLVSISPTGDIEVLPIRFEHQFLHVYLDHLSDGTLYVMTHREVGEKEGLVSERVFYRSVDGSSLEKITDFIHDGCCQNEGFSVSTDGSIWVVGSAQTGPYTDHVGMGLWHIQLSGEMERISPIHKISLLGSDWLSVSEGPFGDIFVTNSSGLLRFWYVEEFAGENE